MKSPIIWSIAGTDSGGGAGLAADQRAADALGVHLAPVVAAVTAQNTVAVPRIEAVSTALLEAQLDALAGDLPPRALKTGLLASTAHVHTVARWADRLGVPLVVDPVLRASTGTAFADADILAAYRTELLPRAALITPNVAEARALTGLTDASVPELAQALHAAGAQAVCITGGDSGGDQALDWLSTPHAQGWLALPRLPTPHHHGTGCTFASSAAAAMALGFVAADACVLAKMATSWALRQARAIGQGAGPVIAQAGFATRPELLPLLSWDAAPPPSAPPSAPPRPTALGALYGIVDSAQRVRQAIAAGVPTLQLRIKTPVNPEALRTELAQAIATARAAGVPLFINDHWRDALALGAHGVHLGQEDVLALAPTDRAALAASPLELGLSSHSLWELARARSLAPAYVACGPVWPTLTKAMPWQPQGLDNLAWWVQMAGVPVVAIGGILTPAQAQAAAACGPASVCVVRGLGRDMAGPVATFQAAIAAGRAGAAAPIPTLPHASLG
ncbi:MAG: bifunctional hydroxymethylpyrimidine kinase/phosphomethylpyrimidine kinase [Proteobacteria bacterium]|nr:bifunctional hydroxymethylpyrimidine kinase/phosphomethylpyrimidine kinase [Pseudomonadota bacterium]